MKTLAQMNEMLDIIAQKKKEWLEACKENLKTGKVFPMVLDEEEEKEYGGLEVYITDKHGDNVRVIVDKVRCKNTTIPYDYAAEAYVTTWDNDTYNDWISLDGLEADEAEFILENVDWDNELK